MRTALLLLLFAALCAWGAGRLESSVATTPIVEAQRRPAPPPASVRPPTASDELVGPNTPLFRTAAAPVEEVRPGEDFTLVGLANGPTNIAYLRDSADGRALAVQAGDEVRGWVVAEIENRCVTLRRARERQRQCLS